MQLLIFPQTPGARAPLADMARAAQPGRGRAALSPLEIPWAGWKDIFWRTYKEVQNDRLMAIAAGAVFFSLLALFPAVTATVSLYGLFAKAGTIVEHIGLLGNVMPEAGLTIVRDQIDRVVAKGDVTLSFGLIIGVALALWSANAGVKAVIDALNVVYEEDEKRGFFALNAVSLAFTIGAIAALLASMGAIVAIPLIVDRVWFIGEGLRLALEWGRWPILILIIVTALSLLYRYGPSRDEAKWRWLSVGSIFAAIVFIAASALFSFYLRNYAGYDATYGSLGTVIGLMMWLWMTMIVVLLGAELNAEIEHQTARDSTDGAPKPLGLRGAAMADTVGVSLADS